MLFIHSVHIQEGEVEVQIGGSLEFRFSRQYKEFPELQAFSQRLAGIAEEIIQKESKEKVKA